MQKNFKPRPTNPAESGFLGIGTGKRKKRILEAEQQKQLAIEESKRQTFLLQLEASKQGYNPEAQTAAAAVKLEETKQSSETNLYVTIGVIVVAVMVGLYFIKRKS